VIPLNDKATKILKFWADQFPDRKPEHFTFPSERYGAGGDDFEPTVFDVDPEMAKRYGHIGHVAMREAVLQRASAVRRKQGRQRAGARMRQATVTLGPNCGSARHDSGSGLAQGGHR
jgi:hypothetical protein